MTKKTGKSIVIACAVVVFVLVTLNLAGKAGLASEKMRTFYNSDYTDIDTTRTRPGDLNAWMNRLRQDTQITRFITDSEFKVYRAEFEFASMDQWPVTFTRRTMRLEKDQDEITEQSDSWGGVNVEEKMRVDTRDNKLFTFLREAGSFDAEFSAGDTGILRISPDISTSDISSPDFTCFLKPEVSSPDVLKDSDKFRVWLLQGSGDITPLGDMQNSNILYTRCVDQNQDKDDGDKVYVQTNRGVLHRLRAQDGIEEWGFIPPNIFQGRLKDLKFTSQDQYMEVGSTPLNLLDGKLTASPEKKNKSILIGTLGYGGNGLYAVNINNSGTRPDFLWAVENMRYTSKDEPVPEPKKWG